MTEATSLAVSSSSGVDLTVTSDGRFDILYSLPQWRFAGEIGSPLVDLASSRGFDRAGAHQQIAFGFTSSKGAARRGAFRLYDRSSVALFEVAFVDPGDVSEPLLSLSTYPAGLSHLGYRGVFGGFSFSRLGADGPWVFFDNASNAFILSPASHFMNASLRLGAQKELISGLAGVPAKIPAGFVHATALAVAPGVNRAFEDWGRFLTDLAGKQRPANDADVTLDRLGYWTDRGATYYYNVPPGSNYAATLLEVKDEFDAVGVRLGYVQIDSWFYPKGRQAELKSADRLGGGVYLYEAAKEALPDGLAALQKRLGLPLITHNRWIDGHSPYRERYAMSGNVSIDPELWAEWMRMLRASGVLVYEQDWLSGPTHARRNLGDGERFMDLMAASAEKEGLALQYCMALPRHFLQGTKYSNLRTIRTSPDRFAKNNWKSFLFNGRLATALGEWPWTDVFMSSETSNLLLATLSGGMVGVGDPLGALDVENLRRVTRMDGVIVKPDDPLTPIDSCYVAQAKDLKSPVVACARTNHGGRVTTYVFAFGQARGPRAVRLPIADLGYAEEVYAYDYFQKSGTRLQPGDHLALQAAPQGAYWIVAPIIGGAIAFLGDPDKFVGNGRKRIVDLFGVNPLTVRLALAEGEARIRLHGFATAHPAARARGARIENLAFDPTSGLFHLDAVAETGASPEVELGIEHA